MSEIARISERRRHVIELASVLAEEANYLDPSVRAVLVNSFAQRIRGNEEAPKREIIYNLTVTETLEYMCKTHGFTVAEMRGAGRSADLAHRRAEVCWVLVKRFGLNSVRVGQILNRDHSTVLIAIKRLKRLAEENHWQPPVLPEELTQRIGKKLS